MKSVKNSVYGIYHSLVVAEHEMTDKAYRAANYANFCLGAALFEALNNGFNFVTTFLGLATVAMFYLTHQAKKEVSV